MDGALAYDLPGHGVRSGPAPLTVAAMAEGVIANVAGPLDLVGLSMGGMAGLPITVRFPGRARSLAVACAATHHYI